MQYNDAMISVKAHYGFACWTAIGHSVHLQYCDTCLHGPEVKQLVANASLIRSNLAQTTALAMTALTAVVI